MRQKIILKWALYWFSSLLLFTIFLAIRFQIRLIIPIQYQSIISWLILSLIVLNIILLILLLIKINKPVWLIPILAIIGILLLPIFTINIRFIVEKQYLKFFLANNLQKFKAIDDYAKQKGICCSDTKQSSYLISSCLKEQGLETQSSVDYNLKKLLNDMNIRLFIVNDSISFFNIYKHGFFTYGYGLAYTKSNIPDSPITFSLNPLHEFKTLNLNLQNPRSYTYGGIKDWYKIIDNWYFYSYFD